jgi:hypothetical protein
MRGNLVEKDRKKIRKHVSEIKAEREIRQSHTQLFADSNS